MDKYLGEWVVYEYSIGTSSENYAPPFLIIIENTDNQPFRIKSVRYDESNNPRELLFEILDYDEDEDYLFSSNEIENLYMRMHLFTDNSIKGEICNDEFETITKQFVGMKKSNTNGTHLPQFSEWSLKEKVNSDEDYIASAELELNVEENNNITNPHSSFYLRGFYKNFVSFIDENVNSIFGNGKSCELSGEIYENSAVFIIKFDINVYVLYEITFEDDKANGKWVCDMEEGLADLIKLDLTL